MLRRYREGACPLCQGDVAVEIFPNSDGDELVINYDCEQCAWGGWTYFPDDLLEQAIGPGLAAVVEEQAGDEQ